MPTINVILVNHLPRAGEGLWQWTDGTRQGLATGLLQLFTQVCESTDYRPNVTWQAMVAASHDLVLHCVGDGPSGQIRAAGGPTDEIHGGATWHSAQGMISEIYIHRNRTTPERLANLAFHELMHNKLDAGPRPRVRDIHERGGAGLALVDAAAQRITPRNIELMRAALGTAVRQYEYAGRRG